MKADLQQVHVEVKHNIVSYTAAEDKFRAVIKQNMAFEKLMNRYSRMIDDFRVEVTTRMKGHDRKLAVDLPLAIFK